MAEGDHWGGQQILDVGFIWEKTYLEWIANMVMVKKVNEKWWIYIDFTNFNKECPKDIYALLRINQIVDAMSGHDLLTFMDAFFSYNQIQIALMDKEKTAFITNQCLLCYKAHHLIWKI